MEVGNWKLEIGNWKLETGNRMLEIRNPGGGVIWDGISFETPVIPAKAGIQSFDSGFPKVAE
jgi:hypothetical protein